jgi:hypothetical protein
MGIDGGCVNGILFVGDGGVVQQDCTNALFNNQTNAATFGSITSLGALGVTTTLSMNGARQNLGSSVCVTGTTAGANCDLDANGSVFGLTSSSLLLQMRAGGLWSSASPQIVSLDGGICATVDPTSNDVTIKCSPGDGGPCCVDTIDTTACTPGVKCYPAPGVNFTVQDPDGGTPVVFRNVAEKFLGKPGMSTRGMYGDETFTMHGVIGGDGGFKWIASTTYLVPVGGNAVLAAGTATVAVRRDAFCGCWNMSTPATPCTMPVSGTTATITSGVTTDNVNYICQ